MAGLARHISAALVVIAMIAAQIMPAWAGCHSQRHAVIAAIQTDAAAALPDHHGASQVSEVIQGKLAVADQMQPRSQDICLGNCGCACGISSAFVLASVIVIDAPHGVVRDPELVSVDLPLGDRPDGPRRPPRTIA